MGNRKTNHNFAHYRVIRTFEDAASKPTTMYGIEGFSGEETITITALSENRRRIKELVDLMNKSELELCHFYEVVENFVYENYGINKNQ